jgi:hypothetical protein
VLKKGHMEVVEIASVQLTKKKNECLIAIPWKAEILSLIKKVNTHCIKEVANGRIMCSYRSCERMSWIMAIGE